MPERKVEYVNMAVERIFGYKPDECIGQSTKMFYPDEVSFILFGKKLEKSIRNGDEVFHAEQELRRKDGEIFISEITTTYLRDGEKFEKVITVVRDITGRKKAEKERDEAEQILHEKEANLRSLVESSESAIWSVDKNLKLLTGNSFFKKRVFEISGRKINAGEYVLEGYPPAVKKKWEGYYRKGFTGRKFTVQTPAMKPSAGMYFRYLFNPIRSEEGNIIGLTVIGQNITDLLRTENNLRKISGELRKLEVHREEIRENERTRIAHDLHDDLGQKMTALNLEFAWLRGRIGVQTKKVKDKMGSISRSITEIIENIKEVSANLNPGILSEMGLIAAIEWHLAKVSEQSGLPYVFDHYPEEFSVGPAQSLVIFRVIQEAVNNIVRHAGASMISVDLYESKKHLEMTIEDNGKGISRTRIRSGLSMGIVGMKERIASVGGRITITGKANEGTRIYVKIPITGKNDTNTDN